MNLNLSNIPKYFPVFSIRIPLGSNRAKYSSVDLESSLSCNPFILILQILEIVFVTYSETRYIYQMFLQNSSYKHYLDAKLNHLTHKLYH